MKRKEEMESKDEFPEKLRWAVHVSYFNGDGWLDMCRADNHHHEGQDGRHLHTSYPAHVKRREMTCIEAEEIVKRTSERILKEKLGIITEFG